MVEQKYRFNFLSCRLSHLGEICLQNTDWIKWRTASDSGWGAYKLARFNQVNGTIIKMLKNKLKNDTKLNFIQLKMCRVACVVAKHWQLRKLIKQHTQNSYLILSGSAMQVFVYLSKGVNQISGWSTVVCTNISYTFCTLSSRVAENILFLMRTLILKTNGKMDWYVQIW